MEWTRDDDKRFEMALVQFSDDFQKLAVSLNKPVEEVTKYYEALVHDVDLIESGRAIVPDYVDYLSPTEARQISSSQSKSREKEKKNKGIAWSEVEHRKFLKGLKKYGKGDWKSISRNFVPTRTSTQVASHAQKYFLRQAPGSKARKRSSIHDTTWVNHADNSVNDTVFESEFDSMSQPQLGEQIPQKHFDNSYKH
ncbi:unnamed protein product [Arabis nemorensis]|uniref:HTH myb-type domain-containing protein n=1 Tax=Arabis nemorensis TaxID=586526 RepID=A0A565CU99_9BRAS|nr:unnamed protein product [Arabis nemorensis]